MTFIDYRQTWLDLEITNGVCGSRVNTTILWSRELKTTRHLDLKSAHFFLHKEYLTGQLSSSGYPSPPAFSHEAGTHLFYFSYLQTPPPAALFRAISRNPKFVPLFKQNNSLLSLFVV